MRLRSIILTFASCVLLWTVHPGAARSQPIQGFYIDAGAGPRIPFSTRTTSYEPGVGGAFNLNQGTGYDAQLSFGYALGNGWRFELEGTLGRGGIRSASGTPFPAASSGSVQNHGVMVNAVFDLDVRSPYVYPYLGLGVGYQSTHLDGFVDTRADRPGAFSASGTTGAFAAQLIAGISVPIPNMPGLSLTVDYRLMDILGGGRFNGVSTIGLAPGSAPVAGSINFHNQFEHAAMFGVRYAFNTPPPSGVASADASAPRAEVRSYEVAFDPRATTLTGRGEAIVRDAARTSRRQGTTTIAVTSGGASEGSLGGRPGDNPGGDSVGRAGPGNASREISDGVSQGIPGVASERQALSARRANTIVAALVADGVPRDTISIQAIDGDTIVSTGPRIAPDRQVEIVTR
jgi:OOP family OmpA-OmpF porin